MINFFTVEDIKQIERKVMKEKFSDLSAGDSWVPAYDTEDFVRELNTLIELKFIERLKGYGVLSPDFSAELGIFFNTRHTKTGEKA